MCRTIDINVREWIRDVWEKWFEEVFPPTPLGSDWGDDEEDDVTSLPPPPESVNVQEEKDGVQRKASSSSSIYGDDILVYPIANQADEEDVVEVSGGVLV